MRDRRRAARWRNPSSNDLAPNIVLVFSGTDEQLYQAQQWLWPLEQVSETTGLNAAVVCRRSGVAERLATLTRLPVFLFVARAGLDEFLAAESVRVALYPNQATLNFQALAAAHPAHVHLSHGESEKISMVSNNLKAYDYVFTAGPAARERISRHLIGFDQHKCIDVGRPQLDAPVSVPPAFQPCGQVTVLYAPTWEGDSRQMSYSSLASAGQEIVEQLLQAGHRVIYRPHPLTGSLSASHAAADRAIAARLSAAGPEHIVDRGADFGWQLRVADIAVVDPSAVAFDALGTDLPLVVVRPGSGAAVMTAGLDSEMVGLDPSMPDTVAALEAAAGEDMTTRRRRLARHHFGETLPGAQIERFVQAVVAVEEERRTALRHHDTGYVA